MSTESVGDGVFGFSMGLMDGHTGPAVTSDGGLVVVSFLGYGGVDA